jgi:hypothetical protein
MEVEDHDYTLAWFDVSKSFRVFFIDNERSLHLRNTPIARVKQRLERALW